MRPRPGPGPGPRPLRDSPPPPHHRVGPARPPPLGAGPHRGLGGHQWSGNLEALTPSRAHGARDRAVPARRREHTPLPRPAAGNVRRRSGWCPRPPHDLLGVVVLGFLWPKEWVRGKSHDGAAGAAGMCSTQEFDMNTMGTRMVTRSWSRGPGGGPRGSGEEAAPLPRGKSGAGSATTRQGKGGGEREETARN